MTTRNLLYGTPLIGCYFDHSYYGADELSRKIIDLAVGYGLVLDSDSQALLDRFDDAKLGDGADDISEQLDDLCSEAETYLNEQETRSFLSWHNDGEAGAFGLWPSVECAKDDCGFVSRDEISEETSQEDPAYPADDFRGEWLHVSDHGNATLYVREDCPMRADGAGMTNFTDREIWSVV